MIEKENNKLDSIQALRGFAAISVVICHLRDLFKGTPFEETAMHWMLPGAYGVDLFFIISGFIIALTSANYMRNDSKKFILKRIIRIWPPYVIWTLLYAVLINRNNLSVIDTNAIIKSIFFIPLNLDSAIYFGAAALPQGWTLNYEAYFYLVFSACLIFGRGRYFALFLWFFLTAVGLPYILHLADPKPVVVGYGYVNLMMQRMMLEFIFGVFCAIIYRNKYLQIRKPLLCKIILFGAFMTPLMGLILEPNTWDHGPTNFGLYYMIAFFLLITCLDFTEARIVIPKTIIKTGNMSFSIYLCHIFVMTAVVSLVDYAGYTGLERAVSVIVLFIPSVYFVSSLSYTFLECKLHDHLHANLINKRAHYKATHET